jgi:hypothetical protein
MYDIDEGLIGYVSFSGYRRRIIVFVVATPLLDNYKKRLLWRTDSAPFCGKGARLRCSRGRFLMFAQRRGEP